jgi:6,7-dimethyl-8-ribityllumazine synthase
MTAPRLLIIAGAFYRDIADPMIKGARVAIEAAGAVHETVEVPGALEIPGAIVQAELAEAGFDGYVALGCVIRGETTHYDYVCGESARGLMDLSLAGLAVGNGVLTVEDRPQAMARAVDKNKGASAAEAALALIALREQFGSAP